MTDIQNRARGAMLGLACGDALGTTVEFARRDSFSLLTEMTGSGPFRVKKGDWTDDTAMALCLAASLTEQKEFDSIDQLKRYAAWYSEGYQACQAECIDIGFTTRSAIKRFMHAEVPYAGETDPLTSGNGGIMRLAPSVIAAVDSDSAVAMAINSSRTTHASPDCLDSAKLLGLILWKLLQGESIKNVLAKLPKFTSTSPVINRIFHGYFRHLSRPQIRSGGYVIDTLEAALWSCYNATSFEEAIVLAVNLGGDADTVAAVAGQIAGAAWGETAIPERWLAELAWRDRIQTYADELLTLQIKYAGDRQ